MRLRRFDCSMTTLEAEEKDGLNVRFAAATGSTWWRFENDRKRRIEAKNR